MREDRLLENINKQLNCITNNCDQNCVDCNNRLTILEEKEILEFALEKLKIIVTRETKKLYAFQRGR